MVRTVKAKGVRALKKGEEAVLLPGPTAAEPWEVWILGTTGAECVQTCATPQENRLRKNGTLALPVSQVFCLPLWLNETDPKQVAGMIPLQLELRGLQPRGHETAVFDWSLITRETTRSLAMVGVLPALLPDDIETEAYAAFDLSARYFQFPENALTLWQEQDHLVVAMTRGSNLVYYQALTEGRITERILQDLNCAIAGLTMQGILTPLRQVVLWLEVNPAEHAALGAALRLPVSLAERPSPRKPATAWKLTPAKVNEAKKTREARRWQKWGAMFALIIYLAGVGWMASHYFITLSKVNELRRWTADNAQAVAEVRDTQAVWKELRPVVDEKNYPLETLLRAAAAIPPDQVHLTLFEANGGHILIKAEARNVAAAFQLLDNLKRDHGFADYTWNMSQPQILANDLAQVQIEGTRAN